MGLIFQKRIIGRPSKVSFLGFTDCYYRQMDLIQSLNFKAVRAMSLTRRSYCFSQ